ncbi:hypothetical protein LTR05_005402 [Lithohypha guttulata]|uniref:PHD-type domain-containing protein n=1 Tax=Lithohypha guttulata TaxID=1690604 RepID=A0AAN7SYF2_9EURO|nr:hypothetical protein LTR05_005402 [Lithohypha guttulata]
MVLLRAAQARSRPQRSPTKKLDSPATPMTLKPDLDSDDEPPTKRLRTSRSNTQRTRWIPGGRGGGGRRIDLEGEDIFVTPRERNESRKPRTARRRGETTSRKTASARPAPRTTRSHRSTGRPRYTTAAAAAAATHSDGYKPREERGWEEYHPDLDLESTFAIVPSKEVDGFVVPDTKSQVDDGIGEYGQAGESTPSKKGPGRPLRTQSSMLQSLLTPEAPKFVPPPGPNPRERLTLPRPSYRILDPFAQYDGKEFQADNFVTPHMANVGYQESEVFIRPEHMIRQMEGSADEDLDLMPDLVHSEGNSAIGGNGVGRVEYDMDEQDVRWLDALNKLRVEEGVHPIKPAVFEITMTKVEKEWHALEKRIPKPNPKAPQTQRPRSSSAAAVNGEPGPDAEPDIFCDGCDLAVHQECYGVPYIPEGQWLCRKCQLVGNARPSCIFCPNEGGAFKQTNNSKWAHLLCATWIPEVTIGNPSLMEPITDVEKVPNSRWKLSCYICKQNMGASVQCSDARCYEPFHLTCARQAGLYLKMKLGGGQNTLMDSTQLRAYCHKHSPADWKAEHRTDRAFEKAVRYFRHHFAGQIWADSKSSALAMTDTTSSFNAEQGPRLTLTNKKGTKAKSIWRLPSGAPVIPEVILKTIEESLQKLGVHKRNQYVTEICKYWTLKREARRGAALLKRLQLQMETFSSFEVTRRDYRAMGAAGRARLERRIEFAELLAKDLERIRAICDQVMKREEQKLEEARLLQQVVDTIYFPIGALLVPVVDKASFLDRGVYGEALSQLRLRIKNRHYSAVSTFFTDFAKIFEDDVGFDASDMSNEQALRQRPTTQLDDPEQRERRTLARRIIKAAYPLLSAALRKESELLGRPFEQQMKEMDDLLFSRRVALMDGLDSTVRVDTGDATPDQDIDMADATAMGKNELQDIPMDSIENYDDSGMEVEQHVEHTAATAAEPTGHSGLLKPNGIVVHTPPASTNGHIKQDTALVTGTIQADGETVQPPTPPISTKGNSANNPLVHGGIPWYVEAFDPWGTTVNEERWIGKDVLRDLSEELSDMDEGDLQDLVRENTDEVITKTGGVAADSMNGISNSAGLGKGWRKGRTGSGKKRKSTTTRTTRARR